MPNAKTEKIINTILAGGIALCVAGIGYLVYRNFSAPEGSGERFVLCAVLGILALLMLSGLWMRTDHKINVLLVVGASVAALYIVELVVLVVATTVPIDWVYIPGYQGYQEMMRRAELAKKAGIRFDLRTRIDVIRDLEAAGASVVPAIPPSIVLQPAAGDALKSPLILDGREFVPLGGIAERITVFCNENGEYTVYKSDEHGFHNPEGRWSQRKIDVALLGDSFTAGACVPTDKSFAARIGETYPATLNLGADNNGPLMELAALREYLVDLRPRTIVWFYFEGNDLEDLDREWKSSLLRNYLKPGFRQGLSTRQDEIDRELLTYVEAVRGTSRWMQRLQQGGDVIRLKNFRALMASALLIHQRDEREFSVSNLSHFRTVLEQAAATVRSWGGTLVFVYLPEWKRYAHPELARSDRDAVLSTVRELEIRVVDMDRVFKREANPLALFPFGQSGHYNELGHQLVANEVANSITRGDSRNSGIGHVGAIHLTQH